MANCLVEQAGACRFIAEDGMCNEKCGFPAILKAMQLSALIRERSGNIDCNRTEAFLYLLTRDHLPLGIVESIVQEIELETDFAMSNGWLATYAKDVANRLKNENDHS